MIQYKEIPKKSGIYQFTNKINGKIYIGKSVNLKMRIKNYKYSKTLDQVISRAVKKYGWENFNIDILHYYDDPVDKWELLALETAFIDAENSLVPNGYNVCLFGNDATGCKHSSETIEKRRQSNLGKKRTEEQKKVMSDVRKGKYCGKENHMYGKGHTIDALERMSKTIKEKYANGYINPCKGKRHSLESREKMSKAHLGHPGSDKQKQAARETCLKRTGANNPNFGKKLTKEHIQKFSKRVEQINKDTNEIIKVWDSIKEATKGLGLKSSYSIWQIINGKGKTAAGFKWRYHNTT